MKKYSIAFILIGFLFLPGQSEALSCLDPGGMVDYYAKEPSYLVVTAVPTENKEHVKEEAAMEGMYDSGYTAQLIEVSEAHRGTAFDKGWVYFERNDTWNYLCAGGPATLGSKNMYVIRQGDGVFGLPVVVGVYAADSKITKDTLKAIQDYNDENSEDPSIYEVTKEDWLTRLKDELKEMAFIVKVKLFEWNFWSTT